MIYYSKIFRFYFSLESDVSRTGAYQAHNVSRFWYKEKMSREDGRLKRKNNSSIDEQTSSIDF
jgi:hypothetical protein